MTAGGDDPLAVHKKTASRLHRSVLPIHGNDGDNRCFVLLGKVRDKALAKGLPFGEEQETDNGEE
jgi:hypothetical protein